MLKLTALVTILIGVSSCAVDLTLPQYERSPTGFVHTAGIAGELVRDGRCLLLRTPDGVNHLLAWPHPGTTWNPSERSVTVDAVEFHLGEAITVGGGEFKSPLDGAEWVVPPWRECWRERRWLVEFIPGSDG